jgi:hypothetical protein
MLGRELHEISLRRHASAKVLIAEIGVRADEAEACRRKCVSLARRPERRRRHVPVGGVSLCRPAEGRCAIVEMTLRVLIASGHWSRPKLRRSTILSSRTVPGK